eukprot:TRINITY_DN419_c1_g4_i1.p1 TRINITY_DN419_c1_g4~~TRINITY_DN419_c1_g4_i1.p1  ORF type:complete len:142 (+),score=32.19 TRINITY_DN419_c1_g4_i1:21-446(+)
MLLRLCHTLGRRASNAYLLQSPFHHTAAHHIARFASMSLTESLQSEIASHPVVVYSKTFCPYCDQAKDLIRGLGVNAHIVELDKISNGSAVQTTLTSSITNGHRTVPMVFVGGEFIGGCDATVAAHRSGKLVPKLKAAKAL